MSIASEISRLQTAKADIRQAIIDKGVNVPTADTIDQYPQYISLISGGGGGGSQTARLLSYDPSTGILTGENFGTVQGAVYLLDRATHTEVLQPVSSWSDTSITLTTPLVVPYWSSSIYVKLPGNECSNKIIVTNTTGLSSGYGTIYYLNSDQTVSSLALTGPITSHIGSSTPLNNQSDIVAEGVTIKSGDILGIDFGSSYLGNVGSQFFQGCASLDQPIRFLGDTIGQAFLQNCYAFNQPVDLPNVTSIDTQFMSGCYAFNQPVNIPGSISTIGRYFMSKCYAFNQPLELHADTIDSYFLPGCYAFDNELSLPTTRYINSYFLQNCTAFNHKLAFPLLTRISDYFLAGNDVYNSEIDFPELETVGNYFLDGVAAFNAPLNLPELRTVGDGFLRGCVAFNQEVSLPSLAQAPAGFMTNCYAFNSKLSLPLVASVAGDFLYGCYAFNQNLSLPALTSITGENFMRNCWSFNSELSMPVLTTISGSSALYECAAFNKDLDLSSVTGVSGSNFMCKCASFNHTVTIRTDNITGSSFMNNVHACSIDVGSTAAPGTTNAYTFAGSYSSSNCVVSGHRLIGANAAAWHNAFPDSTTRKTIVV